MLKRILILGLAAVLACGTTACKKKKVAPEPGQLSDAERAKIRQNAIRAYQDIVKKYPDSPYAPKARERLNALGVVEGQQKK